jgi:hypothetical protein
LKRRPPRLEPRARVVVYCEGKVTEPCYIEDFRREEKSQLVQVIVYPRGESPKTLVETAASEKKEAQRLARRQGDAYLKYDEVWCVFDVDEHPRLPDAIQQACDNGINLAISNPCFELWALLHYREQTAYLERHKAQSLLRQHLPNYHKCLPFEEMHEYYEIAVQRARTLKRRREEAADVGGNPSTGVYRLTEQIRKLGQDAQLSQIRRE